MISKSGVQQANAVLRAVLSNRDSLNLLLRFLEERLRRPAAGLNFPDLAPGQLLTFLAHVETNWPNSAALRNVRLAVLHTSGATRHRTIPSTWSWARGSVTDYMVTAIEDNQPTMLADLQAMDFSESSACETLDKGHDRIDRCRYWAKDISDSAWEGYAALEGRRQAIRVERERSVLKTGAASTEVTYALTLMIAESLVFVFSILNITLSRLETVGPLLTASWCIRRLRFQAGLSTKSLRLAFPTTFYGLITIASESVNQSK